MSATVLPTHDANKKINIDFSDTRRKSFLPDSLQQPRDTVTLNREASLRTVRILECNEDDALFMYVGGGGKYDAKPLQRFCTGSKYLGHWNKLGIAGKGIYKYPHGVIYDGYFNRNGEFHGSGVLVYPNGQKIEGIWRNGKLGNDSNFVTAAGIVMNEHYCMMPDRRFQIELENGFNPAGQEYLTDEKPPPREIPEDCYDLVEGYYDPAIKTVYAYPKHKQSSTTMSERVQKVFSSRKSLTAFKREEDENESSANIDIIKEVGKTKSEAVLNQLIAGKKHEQKKEVLWIPSVVQEEWIVGNCRKAWDQPTGYRPDLYEEWNKGVIDSTARKEDSETSVASGRHSVLKSLNIADKKPKTVNGPRFVSFIQTRKDEDEATTLSAFKKMFLEKEESEHDSKNHLWPQLKEYYVTPGERP